MTVTLSVTEVQTEAVMLNIIPTPRSVKALEGSLDLSGLGVFVEGGSDERVVGAAAELCEKLERLTGKRSALSVAKPSEKGIVIRHEAPAMPVDALEKCIINCGEDYRLTVGENGVLIEGGGAAGAFYGIQSLILLAEEGSGVVPCCSISDAPEFAYRGFYHDVTRGRVPTLQKLKEIVCRLSRLKINSLQLYIEDAFAFKEFEGTVTAEEVLTPCEIVELDSFCRRHFIELVPSLSTFGHLFTLLQSDRYNHICELVGHKLTTNYWMEKQWHHTVNVYHPDTRRVIGSMIEQYLPLFTSPYFNICCDETMDLCRGANEGKDKGEAYFYHVTWLIDLLKSHGKAVMMWGDECMARPEESKKMLPEDTVILNWCYRKDVNEWIPRFFSELGFSQIACTGTCCWDNFIENVDSSVGNISSFSKHAKKYGALGLLNTNWGDFGHLCAFNCNLYGMLFGAEKSWNPDSETGAEFEAAASRILYQVTEFNMIDVLRELSAAAYTSSWTVFVLWHSAVYLEGKDKPLNTNWMEHFDREATVESLGICERAGHRLASLKRQDPVIEDMILAVQGLSLLNRLYLFFNNVQGFCDGKTLEDDLRIWLGHFSSAWLRDCKPSGLPRLSRFIEELMLLQGEL